MEIAIAIIKFICLLIGLYREKDRKKAEEKAALAKEMTDAFKQTNPKIRASRINSVVHKL